MDLLRILLHVHYIIFILTDNFSVCENRCHGIPLFAEETNSTSPQTKHTEEGHLYVIRMTEKIAVKLIKLSHPPTVVTING